MKNLSVRNEDRDIPCKSDVDSRLNNVPNVTTNNQTPTYSTAVSLAKLVTGEKLGAAFGKIAKAVDELIVHLSDGVRHITAEERTAWNGKAAGNHTHSAASQSAAGLMSAADKTKLDGIATGANKYTHPATAGNKHIPSGGATNQILAYSASGTAAWSGICNAAAIDVVTGSRADTSNTTTVSYKAGRTKALLMGYPSKVRTGYLPYYIALATGISSDMAAEIRGNSTQFEDYRGFAYTIRTNGNIEVSGYIGSYCVIWFN